MYEEFISNCLTANSIFVMIIFSQQIKEIGRSKDLYFTTMYYLDLRLTYPSFIKG